LLTVVAVGAGCSAINTRDGRAGSGEGQTSGGASGEPSGEASGGASGEASGGASGQGGAPDLGGVDVGATGTGGEGSAGAGGSCVTQTSAASLQPVYLAFAFDVSGSMGQGDKEWHDKEAKWDPVVAATKQFFSDPASSGLTASLTFFPDEKDVRCTLEAYAAPDVPLTPLPSDAFKDALDAIEPKSSRDWRGGTPTAWVMEGTIGFIEAARQENPGKYAIVLVTDGYPQDCDEESNSIDAVVADAREALAKDISTYVIGVENPPIEGAPDTLSDLHEIAAAGGTEEAILIDTGNPSQTTAAFKAAVDRIRGAAVSCTMEIPPAPDGRTFDKEKVRVLHTTEGSDTPTALAYDQSCATEGAWRYDDPASPTQIELCPGACDTIQADVQATLSVDFTCESVIVVPR
jgi:hypothetical protein